MSDIKPNVTGYLEPVLRLAGISFLVPLIVYLEWMVLVPVPFYILVTIMGGYDPLKALLVKLFSQKKSQRMSSSSPPVVCPESATTSELTN
ncbi:hypothetical protein [Spirosoma endophyticum]|uniref:Uncharacterized protein n=1 Tax=Spirosoma endophyticum TaxID=662367 RepID=A0A1I2DY18_9BACT|nr:hypothetical protein [Spirosoma endophyticum]SFE84860.1 hypothetical protein SAMN05216167_12098 [Spirosoma endophyticum]